VIKCSMQCCVYIYKCIVPGVVLYVGNLSSQNFIICMLGVECAFGYAVEHTDLNREIIIKWIQLKQQKRQILTYFSHF
jgi:hypothetical protein